MLTLTGAGGDWVCEAQALNCEMLLYEKLVSALVAGRACNGHCPQLLVYRKMLQRMSFD
jgi:hypothetical protein